MNVPVINTAAHGGQGAEIHAVAIPCGPGEPCGIWLYEVHGGFISREVRLTRDLAESLWRSMIDPPALRFLSIPPERGRAIHLALDGALRTFEAAEQLAALSDAPERNRSPWDIAQ